MSAGFRDFLRTLDGAGELRRLPKAVDPRHPVGVDGAGPAGHVLRADGDLRRRGSPAHSPSVAERVKSVYPAVDRSAAALDTGSTQGGESRRDHED